MADLFGKKPASKAPSLGGDVPDLQSELASISRRLKLIESRLAEQDRKTELIESNMLSKDRRQDETIKTLDSELIAFKKEMEKIKERMMLIIKELQLTAKAEDLEAIKRYLELWRPITFVTRKEVEKIVEDVLEEKSVQKIER